MTNQDFGPPHVEVTVLPSMGEAFGLSLVESLACGTPIVGCDHAALPELVSADAGALALGDAQGLAEACARVLAQVRESSIADRCRQAARAYDWDSSIAPSVEALYLSSE